MEDPALEFSLLRSPCAKDHASTETLVLPRRDGTGRVVGTVDLAVHPENLLLHRLCVYCPNPLTKTVFLNSLSSTHLFERFEEELKDAATSTEKFVTVGASGQGSGADIAGRVISGIGAVVGAIIGGHEGRLLKLGLSMCGKGVALSGKLANNEQFKREYISYLKGMGRMELTAYELDPSLRFLLGHVLSAWEFSRTEEGRAFLDVSRAAPQLDLPDLSERLQPFRCGSFDPRLAVESLRTGLGDVVQFADHAFLLPGEEEPPAGAVLGLSPTPRYHPEQDTGTVVLASVPVPGGATLSVRLSPKTPVAVEPLLVGKCRSILTQPTCRVRAAGEWDTHLGTWLKLAPELPFIPLQVNLYCFSIVTIHYLYIQS